MPGLPELAAAGDLRALEDAWLERLPAGLPSSEAAEVFSRLCSTGDCALALQLLEVALDAMGADAGRVPADFLVAAAEHFDSSPQLRSLLIEMLRDDYLMFEPLDKFLRLSGLLEEGRSLKQSWAAMQRLLRFREGEWVLHENLGPGRIVRMTRDAAIIDFEGSPAYGMKLDILLGSARPLSPESPAVARRLHRGDFERLLEDPGSLLRTLLADSGGRLTRQEAAAISGPQDAAVMWKKLLEAAGKDPATTQSGDAIEERSPVSPEQAILGILSTKDPLAGRNREIAKVLRQLEPAQREIVALSVLQHLPRLKSPETGSLFELHWMLHGEPPSTPVPDCLLQFVEKSAARAIRAMGEMASMQCRKAWIEGFLFSAPDEELKEFFDSLPRNLWLPASEAARRTRADAFQQYLDAHLSNKTDPDRHLRAVELLLTAGLPEPPGFDATTSILDTLSWARAEQARRAISALLNNRLEDLQAHLRSLDSRRLGTLADSLAGVGAAQDTGLVLEVLRELSSRRSGTGEKHHFWQGEYLYDSQEAIDRRRASLQKMRSEEIPAAARAIAEAASHGDLSENAEYKAALERRDLLLDSIRRGLKQLERLRPYPVQDLSRSISSPGTRVILDADDGSPPLVLSLVGPLEADPEAGRINYLAPLGAVLSGCAPGDEVEIQGDSRRLKVTSIEVLAEAGEAWA